MIIIDKHDQFVHFGLAQAIARLRIETKTGLQFRASTLVYVQKVYGVKSRTKKGALAELEALYESTYGRRYGEQPV